MSTALTIPPQMTLEQFLTWDGPGPGRWQLIDGVPVAMAPAGSTHGILQTRIGGLIDTHLLRRGGPSVAMTNPGIVPAFRANRNFFIPDLAVTCSESDIGVPAIRHPVPIVEILSPANHAETWRNIRAYMLIPSVREIPTIRADAVSVDLLRRRPDASWPDDLETVTEGSFTLASIDLTVTMDALYDRSGLG